MECPLNSRAVWEDVGSVCLLSFEESETRIILRGRLRFSNEPRSVQDLAADQFDVARTKIVNHEGHEGSRRDCLVGARSLLFGHGIGNVGVGGRHQFVHTVLFFFFVMGTAFVQPALEVFARGGTELGKEESGAALIAGPDHVGVSL